MSKNDFQSVINQYINNLKMTGKSYFDCIFSTFKKYSISYFFLRIQKYRLGSFRDYIRHNPCQKKAYDHDALCKQNMEMYYKPVGQRLLMLYTLASLCFSAPPREHLMHQPITILGFHSFIVPLQFLQLLMRPNTIRLLVLRGCHAIKLQSSLNICHQY